MTGRSETPSRSAAVYMHGRLAGRLDEQTRGRYTFTYMPSYDGPPVSLTLPSGEGPFQFESFPAFFDGLLPEGWQLEALLRSAKIDRGDLMGQLLAVGGDTVGAVTVGPWEDA